MRTISLRIPWEEATQEPEKQRKLSACHNN
jgi:hypothetical protein